MIDWRGVGLIVRKRGQQSLDEYVRKYFSPSPGRRCEYLILSIPVEYLKVGFSAGYSPEVFLTPTEIYARHSPEERRRLSDAFLEAEKNGRPINVASRQAATVACYFYDAWRNENRQLAINDYGHRGEMRNMAAEAVVEDMFAWMLGSQYAWRLNPAKNAEQFFYIVRELMDKPAKRRDPSVASYGNEMDILCTIEGWAPEVPPKPPANRRVSAY
jgi:hypothetical protein